MDEQLRSEFFGVYCFVFDLCLGNSQDQINLYSEFIKFAAQNHTFSMTYGKNNNLKPLIEVKMREVYQEMDSKIGI